MSDTLPTVAALQTENAALRARLAIYENTALTLSEREVALLSTLFRGGLCLVYRVLLDDNQTMGYVSPSVRTFGVEPEDIVDGTITMADLIHPDDYERVAGELMHYLATTDGSTGFAQQYRIVTPRGTLHYVYDHSIVQTADDGTPAAMVGYIFDTTAQQQASAGLELTRSTLETAADAITWFDFEGNIRYMNAAALAMYGYTADEIPHLHAADFLHSDMHPFEMWRDVFIERLRAGNTSAQHFTYTGRRKDGSLFPIEVSVSVIRAGDEQYVCAIIRDISERQQREQETAALKEQVITAQRAALRELSTPLIPITDDTVIMPLIGALDEQRAAMIQETLLVGVSRYNARLALLDITGVAAVDTHVAQALIQAAQAVRLLGARVVITGIQPAIAQTLVHLGEDLGDLETYSTLQAGIARALRLRG